MPYLARASLLWMFTALTLPACSGRTLDSDGTDSGSSEEASSTPVSTGMQPTTVGPTTDPNPTTSTTDPGPSTSTSTTSTTTTDPTTITGATTSADPSDPSDPSMPGTTDDPTAPQKLDMGGTWTTVPDGIWEGCTKIAPPGTAIKGESGLGQFTSTRAFFGYTEANGTIWTVRLVFLDDSADLELAFNEAEFSGMLTTGPAADVNPSHKFTVENPFWVGTDPEAAISVIAAGETDTVIGTIDITGHQGSWDVADPADPARLQGSLSPGAGRFQLSGDFDAVFCDRLVHHIIVE